MYMKYDIFMIHATLNQCLWVCVCVCVHVCVCVGISFMPKWLHCYIGASGTRIDQSVFHEWNPDK